MAQNYDIIDFSADILGADRLRVDSIKGPDMLAAAVRLHGGEIKFPEPVHFSWMSVGDNGTDAEDEFEQEATALRYDYGMLLVSVTRPEGAGATEVIPFERNCPDIPEFIGSLPKESVAPLRTYRDSAGLWLDNAMVKECIDTMRSRRGVERVLDRIDALDHSFAYSDDPGVFRRETERRNDIKAVVSQCYGDKYRKLEEGIGKYWDNYSRPPFSMDEGQRTAARLPIVRLIEELIELLTEKAIDMKKGTGTHPESDRTAPAQTQQAAPMQAASSGRAPESVPAAGTGVSSLTFEEDRSPYYNVRTQRNADESDMTVALAVDWNTAGEKCTRRCAENSKAYNPACRREIPRNKYVAFSFPKDGAPQADWERALGQALSVQGYSKGQELRLNVAGNGIYTLAQHGITQEQTDAAVLEAVKYLRKTFRITEIRSGGQTGVDEAGIKAAMQLGIPAKVLAPQGWRFRNAENHDIRDERAFKARFSVQPRKEETQAAAPVKRTFKEIVDGAIKAGKIVSAGELRDGWALVRSRSGKFNYSDENGHLMAKKGWFDSATEFKGGKATIERNGVRAEIDTGGVALSVTKLGQAENNGVKMH